MTDEPITKRDLENAVQGATLAVQVHELSKDVGSLTTQLEQHEARHESDRVAAADRRRSDKKFKVTATIGASSVGVAVLALLADIAQHVHR